MNIGLSITHAAHRPERLAAYRRLHYQLPAWPTHLEDSPGAPHEWSERQWRGGLALGTNHVACLNDDIVLCEDFENVLPAAIAARPGDVLCLAAHGSAADAAKDADARGLRWVTSHGQLVGQAYVFPAPLLREFLEWRAECVKPETLAQTPKDDHYLSEDGLINLWCLATRRPVYHTVPALFGHDTEVESCFGNEGDWGRHAAVPMRSPMPHDWSTEAVASGAFMNIAGWALLDKLTSDARIKYDTVRTAYALRGGRAA